MGPACVSWTCFGKWEWRKIDVIVKNTFARDRGNESWRDERKQDRQKKQQRLTYFRCRQLIIHMFQTAFCKNIKKRTNSSLQFIAINFKFKWLQVVVCSGWNTIWFNPIFFTQLKVSLNVGQFVDSRKHTHEFVGFFFLLFSHTNFSSKFLFDSESQLVSQFGDKLLDELYAH